MPVSARRVPFVVALGSAGYAEWAKQDLIERTNAFRGEFGLPAYEEHPTLMKTAQIKADKLVRLGIVQHIMPSGESSFDLIKSHGYVAGATGENLAGRQSSIVAMLEGWKNSPRHRKALLYRFVHVGVGLATHDGDVVGVMHLAVPRRGGTLHSPSTRTTPERL